MHLHTAGACLPLGQLVKLQKGSKCEKGVQFAYIPGGAVAFLHIRCSPRCDRRPKVPLNKRQKMYLHTAGVCLQLGQLVKLQKGSKCVQAVQYAYIPGGGALFLHTRGSPRCEKRSKAPLNERQMMHLHIPGTSYSPRQLN